MNSPFGTGRPPDPGLDDRVLVLVKGTREGELTRSFLARENIVVSMCETVAELLERLTEGAACAVLAEELLTKESLAALAALLAAQPAWSDIPLILFSARPGDAPAARPALEPLGNVVVLDRPVHVRSMLAAVEAAVRNRRRQYEGRRAIEGRDMFLAMLGHELRNPLGAIRMAIGLLDLKWKGGERPRELAIADRQSQHLARLLDDLLDVARVTHGKVALQRETIKLADVVLAAFEPQQANVRERGLSCVMRVAEDHVFVDGDRERLVQVFSNLLSNAVKYTPSGGHIAVDVGFEGADGVVTVTDTGAGLSPDMRERVFEVFTQADDTVDRRQGGIGLGLALVRSLLRLHGGDVEATSEGLGRGSTFRVRLPRVAPRLDSSSAPTAASGATITPMRIVVVEDNEDSRDLLKQMLEDVGHEVICVDNGLSGVDRILTLHPDIAFVDLGLPELDGMELARRVRAGGYTARLVAISGYGHRRDKESAAEAGFDEHLTKPVDPSRIERAIHALSVVSSKT